MAVVTPTLLAACGSTSDESAQVVANSTTATQAPEASGGEPAAEPVRWARANLGFVSAYVLARGNTAAIVDTGVSGSAAAIGEALGGLGLNYSDVDHVVLTHKHGDHAGSIAAVVAEAVNATVYAGEADLSDIDQADIVGISGGEDVFGCEMLSTPGHTAGHMCVIDHSAGLLVAGDAIFGDGSAVVEGSPNFFEDIPQSRESIKMLAELSYNTVLFGHGEPIETGADAAVAALAASLG